MKFHLVYSGALPASANKSKPEDVIRIRDALHPQMKLLWETHTALNRLRSTAVVLKSGVDLAITNSPFSPERDVAKPIGAHEVDLCAPMEKSGRLYRPLVSKALDLNCSLSILFLRQEDPGSLVLQGGDLDGRIKTLCDALTVPVIAADQGQHETYCLMESDTLVAGIEVETGRLLLPKTDHPHEVHLVIEVEIRVLRVGEWNVCLLGS